MFDIKKKKVLSLEIFTFDCNGCGKCIRHCMHNVLKMVNNGYCKYTIVKFRERCNGCGKCKRVCTTNAIQLQTL